MALHHKLCNVLVNVSRGIHPPETMIIFPLVSDFPPFPKILSDSVENFPDFIFSEKNFHFHPPKFLMTFLLL